MHQTAIHNKNKIHKGFILLTVLIFTAVFKSAGQIALTDEAIPLKPKDFYIEAVTDQRVNKNPIAQVVVKKPENKTAIEKMNLRDGTALAISRFLDRNLPKDKTRMPVVIGIKELNITETSFGDGRVDGHIKVNLSFGLQKNYGVEHLINYPGGLHYIRSIDNVSSVERNLRSMLTSGLTYFNDWVKENLDSNKKLAKKVKISFRDYTEKPEGDTIYYADNRPLTWHDFQSRLRPNGSYTASVMPSIGYDQQAEVENGTVNVSIVMKAYLPKSASWASVTGRDEYALNHEQRHFDLVKIIAEQFKQKVLAARLTPDTFEAFINMQYLDSFRDMNAIQKAYDKETAHGMNKSAQEEWNKRIDRDLKSTKAQ
jgi:hypothetical protein